MFSNESLVNYAKLVLKYGVNLQNGQGLEIACPVDCKETARVFTSVAYQLGAKIVRVRWNDDVCTKINYQHAQTDALCDIPKWFVDSKNDLVKRNFCYVAIDSEDPSLFNDCDAQKLAKINRARAKKLRWFSDAVMADQLRWCVVSVPNIAWAERVFPNSANPIQDLTTAIERAMRLDTPNPVSAWDEHVTALNQRAEFLNGMNFEYLHYQNSLGTDFTVGLCKDHVWLSAKEKSADGKYFIANMPTEEVFTAPHSQKADGIVKSALPLSYNGQIIENFSLTFKKGKVIDFSAEKGYDALKHLLETDGGTKRLGEVALIGKNSPIAKSGVLFYNTLFDENASCHFALGKAYPTNVLGGVEKSKSELKKLGVNDSSEHVDFMIGTNDLSIVGITHDGKKVPVFIDGEWAI